MRRYDETYQTHNVESRYDSPIELLVIHATADDLLPSIRWLCERGSKVSAHFVISKTGRVYQLASVDKATWHAGKSRWGVWGSQAIQSRSIGIELENANSGHDPYPLTQITALLALCRDILKTYPIRADNVVRHADIAIPAGRKTDPAGFDWAGFKAALFAAPAPPPGLAVVASPRISLERWTAELAAASSPVAGQAALLYAIPVHYGLDPAVALAFFGHESRYGTTGLCAALDLKNWGSVRTVYNPALKVETVETKSGPFVRYASWEESLRDWCERIINRYIRDRGLSTVEAILDVYAPPDDNNDTEAYKAAVRADVARWQASVQQRYIVTEAANVRQGPGRNFPIAAVMQAGETLVANGITQGESIGGNAKWAHRADGLGFVHCSLLRPA